MTYRTGGAVPLNSAAYISRSYEHQILTCIDQDRWVLLLGPRQHGKTTSLFRILSRVRDNGYLGAFIDLQSRPECDSYESFLKWFAEEIAESVGTSISAYPTGTRAGQLSKYLSCALPEGTAPLVIIVDEAAAVTNCSWGATFYGQLRAIYNKKANEDYMSLEKRIIVVFSGTFFPDYLMPADSVNSPFNVCERVDSLDITPGDISALQQQIEGQSDDDLSRKIYAVVGGQPFLVQWILDRLHKYPLDQRSAQLDNIVNELMSTGNDHLISLFRKISRDPKLVEIAVEILAYGNSRQQYANPSYTWLYVLGLVQFAQGLVTFRNLLYQTVAANLLLDQNVVDAAFGQDAGALQNRSSKSIMTERKICILFLAANPVNTELIRTDLEYNEIDKALRLSEYRNHFRLELGLAMTWPEFQGQLLRHKPQVVHFSGHGNNLNELILENKERKEQPIPVECFTNLFRILANDIRCVLLSACYSKVQATEIAKYVDCVVGTSAQLWDEAAIAFSSSFYEAIGYGQSIADAFDLARNRLAAEDIDEGNLPDLIVGRSDPTQIVLYSPVT